MESNTSMNTNIKPPGLASSLTLDIFANDNKDGRREEKLTKRKFSLIFELFPWWHEDAFKINLERSFLHWMLPFCCPCLVLRPKFYHSQHRIASLDVYGSLWSMLQSIISIFHPAPVSNIYDQWSWCRFNNKQCISSDVSVHIPLLAIVVVVWTEMVNIPSDNRLYNFLPQKMKVGSTDKHKTRFT